MSRRSPIRVAGAVEATRSPRAGGGEVRIIGGRWKRTRLTVPDRPGLRPTPDRVRETLFNWLGQDLTGLRCLDAFAGSGALGLEAASRGAVQVCLIERDPQLVRALSGHVTRLNASAVAVVQADAVGWLGRATPRSWDVIFLDPPFGDVSVQWNEPLFRQALQAAVPLLADDGVIYLEAPRAWTVEDLQGLSLAVHRHGKAGMVHFHLLKRAGPGASGDNPTP